MYAPLLHLHHYTGYAVLLAGLYAITKSALGVMHKRDFTKQENIAHAIFLGTCHLQLLLGLILYFISDKVNAAFQIGMSEAMKNPELRFVAVEHISIMIIAVVLVQVGRIISKKQADAAAKHKKALVFFTIGFVLILSRVPWDKLTN
jgi:hypothetical protein